MMAGRKKRDVPREPNGRADRARHPISLTAIRGGLAAKLIDGRMNNPFGLMSLHDEITQEQFTAGNRYADAERAYRAAIGAPATTAPAQDVLAGGGHPGETETPSETARKHAAIEVWDRAQGILTKLEVRALDVIVVRLLAPEGAVQRMALKNALTKLARHWGYTR